MKPPWFTKLAALAAVVLLLLLGLGLIEDVVRGRQRYRGLTARDRDRRALSAESLFSLALFAVLALVMVLTRKVNWYGLTSARAMAPAQPLP